MEIDGTKREPASVRSEPLETVAAAFRAAAQLYANMGSPLFASLCARAADDRAIVALASTAQTGSPAFHLLACVHYLLLRNPSDPLSRYFATLTHEPAPPEQAFSDFAPFCAKHREEILTLLATRVVQTTYVERCRTLMPALSQVADEAGEPLNLVEIGCSAGVLLTFDKYAYDLEGRGRIGPAAAPLTLPQAVSGGPRLRIPKIGSRTGLDLHTIDVSSEEERRWLIALCFPEFREQQTRLAAALDVVAQTDIRLVQGDALDSLPAVLADTKSPLCIFHSSCLLYWSPKAKAALDTLLLEVCADRDIYRIGIEPSERFNAWHAGRSEAKEQPGRPGQPAGEVTISRYRDGAVTSRIAARAPWDGRFFEWME